MLKRIKQLSPVRIIALGFALVILLGSLLLMLPCSRKEDVSLKYIDSLYVSTSAVCVTGLITVDPGDTFSVFGQIILAVLIQIGGLGVATCGAAVFLAIGKKFDLKSRNILKEAYNLDTRKGIIQLLKTILLTTTVIELTGAVLGFFVFIKDYPPLRAIGLSLFHAVSAFNNAGFDILGGFQSMVPYQDHLGMNLLTAALIILGGIGFLVIREVIEKRFCWKKFSLQTKVVLSTTASLLIAGTLLFKLSEDITWLGAFFQSVTARTAGFASYPLGEFTTPGLLVMCVLMVIGASPGSTGGGIKTTTFFVLLQGIKTAATNKEGKAFRYALPKDSFKKASVITLLAVALVGIGTYLMMIMEPDLALRDVLFEMSSAFGTAGLSTGITPSLSVGSKILSIVMMFIGRLGPMTIATLWYFSRGERVRYPEGELTIG